jgi:hypothetical protein
MQGDTSGVAEALASSSNNTYDMVLPLEAGIVPRAASYMFARLRHMKETLGWESVVTVEMLEIYNEVHSTAVF